MVVLWRWDVGNRLKSVNRISGLHVGKRPEAVHDKGLRVSQRSNAYHPMTQTPCVQPNVKDGVTFPSAVARPRRRPPPWTSVPTAPGCPPRRSSPAWTLGVSVIVDG